MKHSPQNTSLTHALWRMPVILGIVSGAGLLLALLAGDAWHPVAWLGVGAPLIVITWCAWRQYR